MRHARRLSLGSVCVVALALGTLLSGCGPAPANNAGNGALAGAATTTPTPIPTASFVSPTPSLASLESPGCPPSNDGVRQLSYMTIKGLAISVPQLWNSTDTSEALMPNNEPNAPYQVPLTPDELQAWGFNPRPVVNPDLSKEGYVVQICNRTSVSHTLTSLSVQISSFTPSSGPVTVWHVCQDGPYDALTKAPTGGCGGGMPVPDFLAATLPSDSVGASARATANAQFNGGPDLPVTIDPNKSLMALVAVNGLTSQGTYTLSFNVSVDGGAAVKMTPSDGAILIAPSAAVWTGTTCQTPAMLAKIPAASTDTYYVCPPSA